MNRLWQAIITLIVVAVLSFVAGLTGGYALYHKEDIKTLPVYDVKKAPEIRQKDGSLVAEKRPEIDVKPRRTLPQGYKLERVLEAKIASNKPDCPPVSVDVSLIEKGGEKRLVVGSDDATVVSAVDIPNITLKEVEQPLKWAAGVSYNTDGKYGAWLDRDIGPARVGIEALRTDNDTLYMVRVGIRF